MREILFRGKRLDNGLWIQGCLRQYPGGSAAIRDKEIQYTFKVDPETVGQYTGLKDRNGKKIFEGDIVKVDGKIHEVKYLFGQFFIGVNMPIAYKRFDCEVIGNIHGNPELLKEE